MISTLTFLKPAILTFYSYHQKREHFWSSVPGGTRGSAANFDTDLDPDPDPDIDCHADPNLAFHSDADPDPANQNDAAPDPQHR